MHSSSKKTRSFTAKWGKRETHCSVSSSSCHFPFIGDGLWFWLNIGLESTRQQAYLNCFPTTCPHRSRLSSKSTVSVTRPCRSRRRSSSVLRRPTSPAASARRVATKRCPPRRMWRMDRRPELATRVQCWRWRRRWNRMDRCVCVCVCQNEESARRMASTTSENRKRNEKKSTEKEEARFVSRVTVILTREKERDYLLNLHMSQSTCVGTWIETGVDFYGWQCVCYNGKKSARRMACRTSDTGDTSSKQQQTRRKENYNKSKRPVSSVVDHYHPYRRKKRREAVY